MPRQRPARLRPLVPRPPGQQPAVGFLLVKVYPVRSPGAPLLEEERHAGHPAAIVRRQRPLGSHPAGLRAGLAADDHPVDPVQVQRSQVCQQRFDRQEAHASGHPARVLDAWQPMAAILNRDAQPDVGWDGARSEETGQPFGALGQELIGMPRRAVNRRQYPVDERIGHVLVEQVRHRADEMESRFLPSEQLAEAVLVQSQIEAPCVARRGHRLEPRRHPFGMAVFAGGRHLGATRDRVPGLFGPFDFAGAHGGLCSCQKPAGKRSIVRGPVPVRSRSRCSMSQPAAASVRRSVSRAQAGLAVAPTGIVNLNEVGRFGRLGRHERRQESLCRLSLPR